MSFYDHGKAFLKIGVHFLRYRHLFFRSDSLFEIVVVVLFHLDGFLPIMIFKVRGSFSTTHFLGMVVFLRLR